MADINKVSVQDIVIEYLKKNGFDGLCGDECSCDQKDLFSCDSVNVLYCFPGYKIPCDCGEGCDFHISTEKPCP